MTIPPRQSLVRGALLAGALLACAAPAAQAAHWPLFGGDPGRSGRQPVDAGTLPLTAVWKRTGAGDRNVKTSILTSGGPAASRRVVYGTSDGVVHFRRLVDGAPIGGADIGDEADVFGTQSAAPGADGSVSFADTSTEDALGQVFALHNDTGTIHIAHLDEADGSRVGELPVPGTGGMTAESSLLATPAAADGSRSLFFVAGGRLFKVPVANAQRRDASFGTVARTADVDATPLASPTLLYLDVLGTPTAHVAIGTTDGELHTYRASNLAPGPLLALPPARDVLTAVVPVQSDGRTPGPGSPMETPEAIYVSSTSDVQINGEDSTGLFKLRQDPSNPLLLELVTSTLFPGHPSPAMAVAQTAEPDMADGKLVLGLDFNLFLVSTRDFDVVGSFDTNFSLVGGTTGFQQTTGAVSGGLVYVTNDRGEQWVVRVSDGKPIDRTTQFARDPANTGADREAVGQPAVSRHHVAFGGPDGVFVYRNRAATQPAVPPSQSEDAPPSVELTRPAAGARLSGSPTLSANAADDRGVASVRFLAGERVICTDTAAPFECAYRLTAADVGRTTLVAVATDTAGQTATALRAASVSRFTPPSMRAHVTPRRDRRTPFRFTTSGRVRLPAGLTRAQACGAGVVSIQFKALRKTISTRRANLGRSCGYRSRVTFRSRKRFPRRGRLTVRVRFLGNAVLGTRRAQAVTVRTR